MLDQDKLFLAYEECRADNTAHFRKILELQKELDESRAEIEKLRAALIRITKNVSKSGQDEVFYAIANEALQKDDEGEK